MSRVRHRRLLLASASVDTGSARRASEVIRQDRVATLDRGHDVRLRDLPRADVRRPRRARASTIRSSPTFSTWKPMEVPRADDVRRRPRSSLLALLAGLGAMVLGGVAVVAATRSADEPAPRRAASASRRPVGRRRSRAAGARAPVAKPSTDRVVFRGSHGQLSSSSAAAGARRSSCVDSSVRLPAGRTMRGSSDRPASPCGPRGSRAPSERSSSPLPWGAGTASWSRRIAPPRSAPGRARIVALRG